MEKNNKNERKKLIDRARKKPIRNDSEEEKEKTIKRLREIVDEIEDKSRDEFDFSL